MVLLIDERNSQAKQILFWKPVSIDKWISKEKSMLLDRKPFIKSSKPNIWVQLFGNNGDENKKLTTEVKNWQTGNSNVAKIKKILFKPFLMTKLNFKTIIHRFKMIISYTMLTIRQSKHYRSSYLNETFFSITGIQYYTMFH